MTTDDAPGTAGTPALLLNRYRIDGLLGEGGLGTVYKAYDTRLRRTVAIKTLRHSLRSAEIDTYRTLMERFEREAHAGSRLGGHPNVVTVHDLVTGPDETLYLIQEFVPGGNLADRIAHGPIAIPDALSLIADAARGLQAAHEKGLIHRDIKPANIFIAEDGRALVGDWGVCQMDDLSGRTATSVGHPGTPLYMSPEQQQMTAYLMPASDQFSLGLVLFEMLTGTAYKRMGSRAGAAKIAEQPEPVAALLRRMVEVDPEDRFPSLREVTEALRRIERRLASATTQGVIVGDRAESEERPPRSSGSIHAQPRINTPREPSPQEHVARPPLAPHRSVDLRKPVGEMAAIPAASDEAVAPVVENPKVVPNADVDRSRLSAVNVDPANVFPALAVANDRPRQDRTRQTGKANSSRATARSWVIVCSVTIVAIVTGAYSIVQHDPTSQLPYSTPSHYATPFPPPTGPTVTFAANGTYAYPRPERGIDFRGYIRSGVTVEGIDAPVDTGSEKWYYVRGDNVEGWVAASDLTRVNASALPLPTETSVPARPTATPSFQAKRGDQFKVVGPSKSHADLKAMPDDKAQTIGLLEVDTIVQAAGAVVADFWLPVTVVDRSVANPSGFLRTVWLTPIIGATAPLTQATAEAAGNRVIGYLTTPISTPFTQATVGQRFKVVEGKNVALLSEPNPSSSAVASLPSGTEVAATGPVVVNDLGHWLPVRSGDLTGFVRADYLAAA